MEIATSQQSVLIHSQLKSFIKSFPRGKSIKSKDVTYSRVLKDKLLVSRAVCSGVTNPLFNEIKTNSPFDDNQWSVFLDLNIRTLQRYKKDKNHVFKPIHSEKIFELADFCCRTHFPRRDSDTTLTKCHHKKRKSMLLIYR